MKNLLENINSIVLGGELKNARKAKGLTQKEASEILNVSRTTITAIEKGERQIKPGELVALSTAYDQDVHKFLRTRKSVVPFQVQFRAAYKRRQADEKINSFIDEFEEACRDYLELEQIVNGRSYSNYPVEYKLDNRNIDQVAESIAIRERNRLGLGDSPIPMLRDILEQDVGLRIFYFEMPSNYSEMYNYNEFLGGCMAINTNHPEVRRRWSMSHGYAHFLTHRKELVLDNEKKHGRIQRNEQFADAFAKYFLMPTNSIMKKYDDIKNSKERFTIADIFIVSHYYGVSPEALTRRLEELKLIELGTWEDLKSKGLRVREIQNKLNIADLPQRKDKYPVRYQYLALYAFEKALISEGQFANFMGISRLEAREFASENNWGLDNELELELPLSSN